MKIDVGVCRPISHEEMEHMCSQKRGSYPDKVTAKRYLKKINRKREAEGLPLLNIYRCPVCGKYHLTKRGRDGKADFRDGCHVSRKGHNAKTYFHKGKRKI